MGTLRDFSPLFLLGNRLGNLVDKIVVGRGLESQPGVRDGELDHILTLNESVSQIGGGS